GGMRGRARRRQAEKHTQSVRDRPGGYRPAGARHRAAALPDAASGQDEVAGLKRRGGMDLDREVRVPVAIGIDLHQVAVTGRDRVDLPGHAGEAAASDEGERMVAGGLLDQSGELDLVVAVDEIGDRIGRTGRAVGDAIEDERIVAAAAGQNVDARATGDLVVAGTAVDEVGAAAAADHVVAIEAVDRVV